ncbi:MAG TPA: hypothetical protein PKK78_20890 [Kouleothrix sp.]|uniref:hypothetical protein n=1 Tax=Kouleothrix sp. TaxID=2779161 RepID=UPI002D00570C|nr:hypothetical protein [Kouleothrix sp.]
MRDDSVIINWHYHGKTDYSVGAGATRAEYLLGWGAAALGFLFYSYLYLLQALPWAFWQYLLAAFLGFDVAGGLVCNSLNSCKRFYLTPAQPSDSRFSQLIKNPLIFAALHIHSLLIGLLYNTPNWRFGLGWYLALIGSTVLVLKSPLYLRRPMAMLCILAAILVNASLLVPVQGFAWMMPALFIKIVYGHVVREEPYRPSIEQ